MNFAKFGNVLVNMDRVTHIRASFDYNRAKTELYFGPGVKDCIVVDARFSDVQELLARRQAEDHAADA